MDNTNRTVFVDVIVPNSSWPTA